MICYAATDDDVFLARVDQMPASTKCPHRPNARVDQMPAELAAIAKASPGQLNQAGSRAIQKLKGGNLALNHQN